MSIIDHSYFYTFTLSGVMPAVAASSWTFTSSQYLAQVIPAQFFNRKFKVRTSMYVAQNNNLLSGINLYLQYGSPQNFNSVYNGLTYLGTVMNYLNQFGANVYTFQMDLEQSNPCIINVSNLLHKPVEIFMDNIGGVNFTTNARFVITLQFELVE